MRNYLPRRVPMIRNRRGVGMYPDETCYDPTRPSWLPYWLDDLTESSCKVNLVIHGNTTGNTAQPGTFTTDSEGNVVPLADAAAVKNAQATCAYQGGTWDPSLQACTPSLVSKLGAYLPWLIGGAVALFVLGRR